LKHENSKHLTRCRDPRWVLQLKKSIETIMDVTDKANVASELIDMIETYLLNQGQRTMVDCTLLSSRFLPISIDIGGQNSIFSYQYNQTNAPPIQST
jgi:hypothetical protein